MLNTTSTNLSPSVTQTPSLTIPTREPIKLVVVGHVDHGKSSLIGRLLYDTNSLSEGQLEKVRAICEEQSKPLELAFLLDALEAEQLQGITIDTTRILFHLSNRDVWIIDAPGHKEFLKNMVSGAAQADAALLIIDALEGIQEQSKRHGYLLSMLGIRDVVVLMNKMDLVDYRQAVFTALEQEITDFLAQLNMHPKAILPVSALTGENVTRTSGEMPWYSGPTLLDILQHVEPRRQSQSEVLRLSVQDVYKFDERRIIVGRVESGSLRVGDTVQVLPTGQLSQISGFESWPPSDEPLTQVFAGQTVGLQLRDPLFVERGHMLVHPNQGPHPTRYVSANIFWMAPAPLAPGVSYRLKLGTQEVHARVHRIERVLNASSLALNDVQDQVPQFETAEVIFRTEQPLMADPFHCLPTTGRFVVMHNYDVAGGGIVLKASNELEPDRSGEPGVSQSLREIAHGHKAQVVLLEKASPADLHTLERLLFQAGIHAIALADTPKAEPVRILCQGYLKAGFVVLLSKSLLPESFPLDALDPLLSVTSDVDSLHTLNRIQEAIQL